jgi:hypothetical protein
MVSHSLNLQYLVTLPNSAVFRTLAVTKRVSKEPGHQDLAMEVSNHDLYSIMG